MIIGKTRTNQPVESVEGFSSGTQLYKHTIVIVTSGPSRTFEIINSNQNKIETIIDLPTFIGNYGDEMSFQNWYKYNYHGSLTLFVCSASTSGNSIESYSITSITDTVTPL